MYAFTRQRNFITSEELTPIFNEVSLVFPDRRNKTEEWSQLHNHLAAEALRLEKGNDRNVVVELLAYISEFDDKEQISLIQEYLAQGIGLYHPLWMASAALAYERNSEYITSIHIFETYQSENERNEFFEKCYENFKTRLKNLLTSKKYVSLGSLNAKKYEFNKNGIVCTFEENESPAPPDIDIFKIVDYTPAKQTSSLILPGSKLNSISTITPSLEPGRSILGSRKDIRSSLNKPSPMMFFNDEPENEISIPKQISPFQPSPQPSVTRRSDNDYDDGATEVQPRESFFESKPIKRNFDDDEEEHKPITSRFTIGNDDETEERIPIVSKFSKKTESRGVGLLQQRRSILSRFEDTTEDQPKQIKSRFGSRDINTTNTSILSLPKRQKNQDSARKPAFRFPDDSDDEPLPPPEKKVSILKRTQEIDDEDPETFSRPIKPKKENSSFRQSPRVEDEPTFDAPRPFDNTIQPRSIMKKRNPLPSSNEEVSQHVQMRFDDDSSFGVQPRKGTPTTKIEKPSAERYGLTKIKSMGANSSLYQDADGNSFVVKPLPTNFTVIADFEPSFNSLFLMPIKIYDVIFVTNYLNDGDLALFLSKLSELKFSKHQIAFFVILQLVRIISTLNEQSLSHGNLTTKSFLVRAPSVELHQFDDGEDWQNTGFCLAEVDKLRPADDNGVMKDRTFVCSILYEIAYGKPMSGLEHPVPKRWPADLWNNSFQILLSDTPLNGLADQIRNYLCDTQNCQSVKSLFTRLIINMKA